MAFRDSISVCIKFSFRKRVKEKRKTSMGSQAFLYKFLLDNGIVLIIMYKLLLEMELS